MHEQSNISVNLKPKTKIFLDVYQEPSWDCLAKSLKTKKSHASVPLRTSAFLQARPYKAWVLLALLDTST
jgi:hypothetical protein